MADIATEVHIPDLTPWVDEVAAATDVSRPIVDTVLASALAHGLVNLRPAEEGHHVTRFVMYRRIAEFFRHGPCAGSVLEISGRNGAIRKMIDADETSSVSTSYPEVRAEALPFGEDSFDFVISDQVIEHLQEPQRAVDETRRVLKRNGWLFLATAFMDPVHTQPDNVDDYWRFTPQGLRYLCRKFRTIYQCEGWGNREALAVVLFGGLQKYAPVSGNAFLEGLVARNEQDVPLSVWIIAQK